MDTRAHISSFLYYPTPKAHDIPYEAPAPQNNPVLKGLPLQILTYAVASIPLIPTILYHNAGFASLRKLECLKGVEARFEPAVIPMPTPDPSDGPVERYTSPEVEYVRGLLERHAKEKENDTTKHGRFYSVLDFYHAYKTGYVTPMDVVEALLPLIRRDLNERAEHSTAWIDSRVELVRQAAEKSTRRWEEGRELGVLDGVPFAVKDEMDVRGYKRFNGSTKDYTNGKEVGTSWCVRKLEEEGAVCVGKTSMHEIGMDTTNNNPNWGTPRNPYNRQYYTGGSSGGSAYAVASGLVPFAIGADGGGSVRIPSSFCGLYGLKPSHGRISIHPTPMASTTNVVLGPLAANMTDLAISYRVMAQPDPSHPVSCKFAPPRPSSLSCPRPKILGICKPWFDRADPAVQKPCRLALDHFEKDLGYKIVDIDIPLLKEGQLAHALTILSEAATATPDISHLTSPNKILLSVSRQTPASDWLLAQRVRQLLMQHLASLFVKYPGLIIVTPTTPNAGWPIREGELWCGFTDANVQLRTMEYVWLSNFTGVPCLTVPVGYTAPAKGKGREEDVVPVGLMGHAEWGSEEMLVEWGFEGEEWLGEKVGGGGGRRMPSGEAWVDVLGRARGRKDGMSG